MGRSWATGSGRSGPVLAALRRHSIMDRSSPAPSYQNEMRPSRMTVLSSVPVTLPWHTVQRFRANSCAGVSFRYAQPEASEGRLPNTSTMTVFQRIGSDGSLSHHHLPLPSNVQRRAVERHSHQATDGGRGHDAQDPDGVDIPADSAAGNRG